MAVVDVPHLVHAMRSGGAARTDCFHSCDRQQHRIQERIRWDQDTASTAVIASSTGFACTTDTNERLPVRPLRLYSLGPRCVISGMHMAVPLELLERVAEVCCGTGGTARKFSNVPSYLIEPL